MKKLDCNLRGLAKTPQWSPGYTSRYIKLPDRNLLLLIAPNPPRVIGLSTCKQKHTTPDTTDYKPPLSLIISHPPTSMF